MPKKVRVAAKRGPHKHKMFFSMQRTRVANTSGYCVIIEPNTPTELPEPLWPEAYKVGAMEFDAKLILAAANAVKAHQAAKVAAHVAEDAPRAPRPQKVDFAREAVKFLIENPSEGALTKAGVPKLSAVRHHIAQLGGTSEGLTSDAIYGIFTELQDSIAEEASEAARYDSVIPPDESDLEDADGIMEPVGRGLAALQDGADAGSDEDQDD